MAQIVKSISSFFEASDFSKLVYRSLIILSGLMLLFFLGTTEYNFGQAVLYMFIWLILVLTLDSPEKSSLKPFEEIIIE